MEIINVTLTGSVLIPEGEEININNTEYIVNKIEEDIFNIFKYLGAKQLSLKVVKVKPKNIEYEIELFGIPFEMAKEIHEQISTDEDIMNVYNNMHDFICGYLKETQNIEYIEWL